MKLNTHGFITAIVVIIFFFVHCSTNKEKAQGPQILHQVNSDSLFIAENYTKKEYLIKMRDSVQLFTSVYIPKNQSKEYPILLIRTPYSCRNTKHMVSVG